MRTITRAVVAAASLSFLAQSAMAYDAKPTDVFVAQDPDGRRIELHMRTVSPELAQAVPACAGQLYAKRWKAGERDQYGCWQKQADTVAVQWQSGPTTYPSSWFYLR